MNSSTGPPRLVEYFEILPGAQPPEMPWGTDAPYHRTVGTALIYLVVMILVATVVFLLASLIFGRGEELAPLPPGSSPTRLPAEDITAADISSVRFQLAVRGYKMSEVDWVLHRLGGEIDDLRERVRTLEKAPAAEAANTSSTVTTDILSEGTDSLVAMKEKD